MSNINCIEIFNKLDRIEKSFSLKEINEKILESVPSYIDRFTIYEKNIIEDVDLTKIRFSSHPDYSDKKFIDVLKHLKRFDDNFSLLKREPEYYFRNWFERDLSYTKFVDKSDFDKFYYKINEGHHRTFLGIYFFNCIKNKLIFNNVNVLEKVIDYKSINFFENYTNINGVNLIGMLNTYYNKEYSIINNKFLNDKPYFFNRKNKLPTFIHKNSIYFKFSLENLEGEIFYVYSEIVDIFIKKIQKDSLFKKFFFKKYIVQEIRKFFPLTFFNKF